MTARRPCQANFLARIPRPLFDRGRLSPRLVPQSLVPRQPCPQHFSNSSFGLRAKGPQRSNKEPARGQQGAWAHLAFKACRALRLGLAWRASAGRAAALFQAQRFTRKIAERRFPSKPRQAMPSKIRHLDAPLTAKPAQKPLLANGSKLPIQNAGPNWRKKLPQIPKPP